MAFRCLCSKEKSQWLLYVLEVLDVVPESIIHDVFTRHLVHPSADDQFLIHNASRLVRFGLSDLLASVLCKKLQTGSIVNVNVIGRERERD